MIPVGIDLGTTFSAIAHLNSEGIPTIFPDVHDADLFRTPSVVHLGEYGCLVGSTVENLLEDQPELPVVRHSKLSFGSRSPVFQDHLGRDWTAEAINALILSKLRNDAMTYAYDEVGDAVVTVPAQFGDAQRRGVRRAAELVNLRVSSLVDEPVAAATYLSTHQQKEQTLLVYDLGGGTFDATVLRCSPTEISVLATDGDDKIGGKWIDELIMGQMADELTRRHGGALNQSSAVQIQLRRLAEDTKLKLCKPGRTQVRHNTLVGNQPFEFLMSQHHFHQLIEPMLKQSIDVAQRCLDAANMEWPSVDQVLLVGGSTLIPAVREQLAARTGRTAEEIQSRQPHKAVAFGAALLAGAATDDDRQRIPALRQAIAGYDLGVRVRHPRTGKLAIYKLIKRNSALPTQASKIFKTSRVDQSRMVIEVVQSKGDAVNVLSLGHFSFGPIAHPKVDYPIEVTMKYDHEGIVSVQACDAKTGMEMSHTLSHAGDHVADAESDSLRELVSSVTINS